MAWKHRYLFEKQTVLLVWLALGFSLIRIKLELAACDLESIAALGEFFLIDDS